MPRRLPSLLDELDLEDGSVLHDLVRQGEGIATMPSFMVKADLDAGALVRVLPGFKLSSLELWALLPAGRRAPPRAGALIELLARKLSSRLPRVT